jgi:hypothetical protein
MATHDQDTFKDPAVTTSTGLAIGLGAGFVKELLDGLAPARHSQDWLDIMATAIGGWIGGVLYGIIITNAS